MLTRQSFVVFAAFALVVLTAAVATVAAEQERTADFLFVQSAKSTNH